MINSDSVILRSKAKESAPHAFAALRNPQVGALRIPHSAYDLAHASQGLSKKESTGVLPLILF